jgi:hypothetical protein
MPLRSRPSSGPLVSALSLALAASGNMFSLARVLAAVHAAVMDTIRSWPIKRPGLAFLIVLLAILAAPLAVEAQPAKKEPRIGVLVSGSPSSPQAPKYVGAFRNGLRDVGYVEGGNLTIDYRSGPGGGRWAHGPTTGGSAS